MGTRDLALDSADLEPGEGTRVSHHLVFHTFGDACADSAAGASTPSEAAATCRVWRRGKDKERALHTRVGLEPNLWIERVTFTWFVRELNGVWTRWQLELKDTGLSNNWKRYELQAQITVRKVVFGGPGP